MQVGRPGNKEEEAKKDVGRGAVRVTEGEGTDAGAGVDGGELKAGGSQRREQEPSSEEHKARTQTQVQA